MEVSVIFTEKSVENPRKSDAVMKISVRIFSSGFMTAFARHVYSSGDGFTAASAVFALFVRSVMTLTETVLSSYFTYEPLLTNLSSI